MKDQSPALEDRLPDVIALIRRTLSRPVEQSSMIEKSEVLQVHRVTTAGLGIMHERKEMIGLHAKRGDDFPPE